MVNSREHFNTIEPQGGLAEMYAALEGYGHPLTDENINDAYVIAKDYLADLHETGRRLFVTCQADTTIVSTDMNERSVMSYTREVDDPLVQTDYEMIYGEVDGFRVQEYPGQGGPYLVAEVVSHEYASYKREFDVYLAGVGAWGPHRTKIHEMEDLYPDEPELVEYVEHFRQWIEDNGQTDGKTFLRWIKRQRKNGQIPDLDEWMSAINRALIDDLELTPTVRVGGSIMLLRNQLSAHTAPEMRRARDEELDIMAITVRELEDGVMKGELYCFDPLSRRIGLVPLSQKGMTMGCCQPDRNMPNSDL